MADINLTIYTLDGDSCPTLSLLDSTGLSVIVNSGSPTLATNPVTVAVPQDTAVDILIEKEDYDSYTNTIDVGSTNTTIYITLKLTIPVDFINIIQSCHSYTIENNGTDSSYNTTYTITDLDGNVIEDNLDIVLNYNTSKIFTSTSDGVFIVKITDVSTNIIIRQYIIIDICTILNCVTNRILDILCKDCGCSNNDCNDYCKKDYDMKRIFLLGFDLLNRINKEYRLNSYYNTIDDAKINELKTAQDIINKLNIYCSTCGNNISTNTNSTMILNSTNNSNCGCS